MDRPFDPAVDSPALPLNASDYVSGVMADDEDDLVIPGPAASDLPAPPLTLGYDDLDDLDDYSLVAPDALIFQSDKERKRKRPSLSRRRRGNDSDQELVGLDIGSSSLRAAVVHDGLLVRVAEHPLPEGIMERGLLVDAAALARELKTFWKSASLSTREVNVSLTNRQVTLRTLDLPITSNDDELQLAVKHMAPTVLEPINPKKAIIDFTLLSRAGVRQQVQIAAADTQMVSAIVSAVEKAGLRPVSCEIGPLAECRAIVVPRDPDSAQGIVNVGAETTSFVAASGPDVFFLRTIDVGGNDFTRAVAAALDCPWEEADQLKRRAGLGVEPADPTLDAGVFSAVQGALLGVCDVVAQAIADSRRFYEQTSDGRPVTGLIGLGAGMDLPGLTGQLAAELGFAEIGDPRARDGLDGLHQPAAYAAALGLAAGHHMSLMPEQRSRSFGLPARRRLPKLSSSQSKTQAKRLRAQRENAPATNPNLIGVAVGVVLAAGCFWQAGQTTTSNAELQNKLDEARAAQTSLQAAGPQPTYAGAGAQQAQAVAANLKGTPAYSTLTTLATTFKQAAAKDPEIAVNGTTMTATVTVPADAAPQLLEAVKATPGVSAVSPGTPVANADGTQRLPITFRANQIPVKESTP